MEKIVAFFLFTAVLIRSCAAGLDAQDKFTVRFGNPNGTGPDRWDRNPVLTTGSTQKITWLTTNSSYNIVLWQQLPNRVGAQHSNSSIYSKTSGAVELGEFDWKVQTYEFNLDFSSVFYIAFDPGNQVDQHALFNTNYFNISKATKSSSSSSSSSSSPTSDTSPFNPSPSGSEAPKKSDALKIGLGVGLGVGIPLLLAVGILAGLLLRKRRVRHTSSPPSYDQKRYQEPLIELPANGAKSELPGGGESELPSGAESHELPGDHLGRLP